MIAVTMKEIGDAVANCNISSKESLENAAKETTVAWEPLFYLCPK